MNRRFRAGFLAEDLGILMLRGISMVVPVPRPSEDPGWDCVATLLSPENSYQVLPEDSFYVQIKACSIREDVYEGERARWFAALQLPLFRASVDIKEARIELFGHCEPLCLLTQTEPIQFRCFLGERPTVGRGDGTIWVTLEPILSWTISDLSNPEFAQTAYDKLKPIIQLERKNLELRKFGYYEFSNHSYSITRGSADESTFLKSIIPQVLSLGFLCATGGKHEDAALITRIVSWMRDRGVDPDPLNSIEGHIQAFQKMGGRTGQT